MDVSFLLPYFHKVASDVVAASLVEWIKAKLPIFKTISHKEIEFMIQEKLNEQKVTALSASQLLDFMFENNLLPNIIENALISPTITSNAKEIIGAHIEKPTLIKNSVINPNITAMGNAKIVVGFKIGN